MQLLISGNQVHGLTRSEILNKVWHENNPNAAKHLFGFASWKETVSKLLVLFDVLPPNEIPNKTTPVSMFEQYLMGFLRIHSGMTMQSIAMIWGRDNAHAGRLINKAVKSIQLNG